MLLTLDLGNEETLLLDALELSTPEHCACEHERESWHLLDAASLFLACLVAAYEHIALGREVEIVRVLLVDKRYDLYVSALDKTLGVLLVVLLRTDDTCIVAVVLVEY